MIQLKAHGIGDPWYMQIAFISDIVTEVTGKETCALDRLPKGDLALLAQTLWTLRDRAKPAVPGALVKLHDEPQDEGARHHDQKLPTPAL